MGGLKIDFIFSVFRCTLTKIPETKELLNKSRLPLGVLIHPFRDINVRGYKEEERITKQDLIVVFIAETARHPVHRNRPLSCLQDLH